MNIENKNHQGNCNGKKPRGGIIGGVVLITLGILFLVDQFVPGLDFGQLWPVILIVIGISILFKNFPGNRTQKNS